MPFEKKDSTKKFFTGLNRLKGYWTEQIQDINTTPAQRSEAIKNLMYLSAETDVDKNLARLALLAHYGPRLGFKVPEGEGIITETEVDKLFKGMMQGITGGA
jgi:hypothetical protein